MTDKTMTLEPCPFCGGEAKAQGGMDILVRCCLCGATGTTCRTEEDAIAAWNTRHLSQTSERNGNYQEMHAQLLDMLGAKDHEDAARIIAGHHAREIASQTAERGEAVELEYPEFHAEGMGCGLEDRGITDRYEAMRYGFDEALDQMARIIESAGPLYTAPPPAAGVPDVRSDAENWGNALNDASWLFVDVCPEKSALLFNHAKASLRAAILKYLDLVSAAPSSAIDVAAVRSISEILRAVSKGSERWRSSDSSNPSTLDISLLADKLARAIGDAK